MKRFTKNLIILLLAVSIIAALLLAVFWSRQSVSNQGNNMVGNDYTQENGSSVNGQSGEPSPPIEPHVRASRPGGGDWPPLPVGGITDSDFIVNRADLQPVEWERSWEPFHEQYVDDRGVRYFFERGTGRFAGISWPAELLYERRNSVFISADELDLLADSTISYFIDVQHYEKSYFGGTGSHTVRYTRVVNGFNTTQTATVSVHMSGVLGLATSFNTGLFDNVTVPTIDEADMDRRFEIALREQFGERADRFVIERRTLDIQNGQLIMIYEFGFKFWENELEEYFVSALEELVVEIPS